MEEVKQQEQKPDQDMVKLARKWLAEDMAAERPCVISAWHFMCRVEPRDFDGICDVIDHVYEDIGEELATGHIIPMGDEDIGGAATFFARYGVYTVLAREYGLLMWPVIAFARHLSEEAVEGATPHLTAYETWDRMWTKYRDVSTAKHVEMRDVELEEA